MHCYGEYLKRQCSKQKSLHDCVEPVRSFASGVSIKVLKQNSKSHTCLNGVEQTLESMDMYFYLSLETYLPEDSHQHYAFVRRLEDGLNVSCVLLTYSTGNNKGNFHFVWKCTESEGENLEKSQTTIEAIKKVLPVIHTRAMRRQIQEKFGRLSHKVKPSDFCFIYRELTGDCTRGTNLTEKEIDQRVKDFLDMEDVEIIPDLCAHNKSRQKSFDTFWSACEQVLNEEIGLMIEGMTWLHT